MADYNGWTNKETWTVRNWFVDDMAEQAQDNKERVTADYCEEYVSEYLENSVGKVFQGFIGDIVNSFIGTVDWREIADAVNEDVEGEDEDEDEDAE